uniref:Uncharacterized protein n=1 Tax=Lepeophtheirus salmonis TaxID=72036 RepID=A0A0K2TR79_LEPSM
MSNSNSDDDIALPRGPASNKHSNCTFPKKK